MASISGITAEESEKVYNASVISGQIDENGQLLLKTRGGNIINAGMIIPPKAAVEKAHPTGCIFITTIPTNPGNQASLGIGTWVRWGSGRVPISQIDNDSDFDTVEEIGGAKTVKLTGKQSGTSTHIHAYSGTTSGMSRTTVPASDNAYINGTGARPFVVAATQDAVNMTATNLSHTHNYSGNTSNSVEADAVESHENMPPYIVAYFWKRTA